MSEGRGEATGLGIAWPGQTAARTGYGPDPACQPCPDCGGLECLCRPRFFAGQLLTEQDLNRLDHYIVEKSKLHNRHLVGWGVVCGLEVLCDQCDDRVRVTPGYAISPCGEDIVVCKPDYVDVCSLTDRCRKIDVADCRPYAGADGCEEVEEEWVLAIRYMESPARGMTPLTGQASCGCGAKSSCGGGGCGGAGCSCGATEPGKAQNGEAPRLRRGAPPSCEPTVVCESYRYEVFRKPEEEDRKTDDQERDSDWMIGSIAGVFEKLDGDLARRITCCLRDLERALPKPPGEFDDHDMPPSLKQEWYRWACAAKRSLASYYARIGGGNCEAVAKLGAIVVPSPGSQSFEDEFQAAMWELVLLAIEAMLHCICSNLLPPCPAPEDPRVPLAVITVRRKGCDIVKVCNWTPLRRHVTTFRSLDYWFGWLPLRHYVRGAIEAVCCNLLDLPKRRGADLEEEELQPTTTTTGGTTTFGTMPDGQQPIKQPPPAPPAPAMNMSAQAKHRKASAGKAGRMKAPVDIRLGTRRGRTRVLGRAALAGLGGDGPTGDSLFELAYRRPAYPTGGFANAEDKGRMVDNLAQSGLVRTFAGMFRATGIGERAVEMLGGLVGGMRGEPRELEGRGQVEELRARLDRQEAEIAELRRSLEAGSGKPEGKR
jgi:hypothetical protein